MASSFIVVSDESGDEVQLLDSMPAPAGDDALSQGNARDDDNSTQGKATRRGADHIWVDSGSEGENLPNSSSAFDRAGGKGIPGSSTSSSATYNPRLHRPEVVPLASPRVRVPPANYMYDAGKRWPRDRRLIPEDIYVGSSKCPPLKTADAEQHKCCVCQHLKSHPVSSCYVFIRVNLEYTWECPYCRAFIVDEPCRMWSEEMTIRDIYGEWDDTVVDYSWEGLQWPVLKSKKCRGGFAPTTMSVRRVDLDSPNRSVRTAPLSSGTGRQVTTFTPSEWQARAAFQSGAVLENRLSRVSSHDVIEYLPGFRRARSRPLRDVDLWIGSARPSPPDEVLEEHQCTICLSLKSHPVSYLCGHGHCYACIRLWLESEWNCPDCRASITRRFVYFQRRKASPGFTGPGTVLESRMTGLVSCFLPKCNLLGPTQFVTPRSIYTLPSTLAVSGMPTPDQAYRGGVTGLLFATQCEESMPVWVPFNIGVDPSTGLVDDLFGHAWVQLAGAPNVVDLAECSLTVKAYGSNVLEHPYTILFTPARARLIDRHQGKVVPKGLNWHGNILVVKHTLEDIPVDIIEDEHAFVATVVQMSLNGGPSLRLSVVSIWDRAGNPPHFLLLLS
ncbi:hypothetical protein B0H19DRAFT_1079500 [Mycena capillaripes]|nr:hypothetical protein B0H19DRAFT_1079500 [Mycena capillaripes]